MAATNANLKWLSLVVLTVQNSMQSILLVYSRTRGPPYSAAAAVLVTEAIKGLISLSVAYRNTPPAHIRPSRDLDKGVLGHGHARRWTALRSEVLSPDCWKLAIPAALYVLQNNLQFVAASNLDVASFQVSYQLKILTTAVCSVIMLRRRLNAGKWLALFALTVGVAIVQLSNVDKTRKQAQNGADMNAVKGFSAVVLACTTSGIAGVYFELVLKGSTTDLWIRNVQLSLWSLPPAIFPALWPSWSILSPFSFPPRDPRMPYMLRNFGGWVWAVTGCQVVGGLVTALVIKYSDNLMKGFASSLAIVLSSIAGIFLFETPLSSLFMLGCSIVLSSTWLYNRPATTVAANGHTSSLSELMDKPRYTPIHSPVLRAHGSPPVIHTSDFSPSSVVDVDSPAGAGSRYRAKSPRSESVSLPPFEAAINKSPPRVPVELNMLRHSRRPSYAKS